MILADALRVPAQADPSAPAYKDWLHLNVFDHRSGTVGLVNTSLHGRPGDPRSRVVGAALFDVPDVGWVGNLVVRGLDEALLGAAAVGLDAVGLAVDHGSGTVAASAELPGDRCALRLSATATGHAVMVDRPLPLGPGWISWYVVPRLAASGELGIGDTSVRLDGASAYHDHNWGFWRDVTWQWGQVQHGDLSLEALDLLPDDEVIAEIRALKQTIAVMEIPHRSGASFDGVVAVPLRQAWVGRPETPSSHEPAEVPADVRDELEKVRTQLVDEVASTDDALTDQPASSQEIHDDLHHRTHSPRLRCRTSRVLRRPGRHGHALAVTRHDRRTKDEKSSSGSCFSRYERKSPVKVAGASSKATRPSRWAARGSEPRRPPPRTSKPSPTWALLTADSPTSAA